MAERTTFAYPGVHEDALTAATQPKANGHAPMQATDGTVVTVNDDGSVIFGAPAIRKSRQSNEFDRNLAGELPDTVRGSIAEDYLTGVAADIQSRAEFIANYNRGIDLLGLKIEEASAVRGPRGSISKIKAPNLMKACAQYQATFQGEMLPAAGPAKIEIVGGSNNAVDQLAQDFQSDFNYYLTDIATDYYPDTRRAAFYQAFGGSVFKKIFRCPVRRRPVSESVALTSLIVSEEATDLRNAIRKTHEIYMRPSLVKRMQLYGGWRDVKLGQPMGDMNPARRKMLESQGLAPMATRPQDTEFCIYEGYTDIDPAYYGFDEDAPEGLPVPYKIVIDRDSHQVLDMRRNWKENDEEFKELEHFVKYGMISGLGFLDYGFLHLIGNDVRALSAVYCLLIDAGMFGNFPGGVRAKGIRTSTNELSPALGEWVEVDTGKFDDVRKALMPMPYKDPSPVFVQIAAMLAKEIDALAGAGLIDIGEGRTNVPVGTILSMIEQQTQVISAVHKSNHQAQRRELAMLRELFAENPQDLWRLARKPARRWETAAEFMDLDLVPVSDPNVPSQVHRIMLSQAMETLAQQDPVNIDRRKVHLHTFQTVGIADGEQYLTPPGSGQPQPGLAAGAMGAQALKLKAELPLKQQEQQIKMANLGLQHQKEQREAATAAVEARQREADRNVDAQLEAMKLATARQKMLLDHERGGTF